MKIAVLFDRFGPYHVARLRGAMDHAQVIAVEGAPQRTIYDWARPDLPDSLPYVTLAGAGRGASSAAALERLLDERLGPLAPNTIAIPGWSNAIALATLRWARRRRVTAVCMSESNAWDFKRYRVREWIKSGVVANFDAGLATSDSQIRYLARLGIDDRNISSGYNVVDNDYFRNAATQWRMADVLPPEVAKVVPAGAKGRYFLASARFIKKKNLLRLLEAYAAFRKGRAADPADWPLVLLGDGELSWQIEMQRARLGLALHVHLPGFLQVEALAQFYGSAGAFVHASTTEQWGLVVNEAMAAGLPVAVSSRCGCAQFLVEDEVTGFTFDPFDVDSIRRALLRLAQLPASSRLLTHAAERVGLLGPERFGRGLRAAAEAGAARPSRPGPLDRAALDFCIHAAAWRETGK